MFSSFQNSQYVEGPKNFLESNSLVARFAFLILVLIVFILALRIGAEFLGWLMAPSGSPHLLDGMVSAKHTQVFPQDPSVSGAVPILRSKNQEDGLEFTWSTWINIESLTYKEGHYKPVFHKGSKSNMRTSQAGQSDQLAPGLLFPNNAPGLYIAPNTNDLVVVMNTFEDPNEMIVVEDIPLNKWVSVIIRCDNQDLDIYINGTIAKRHVLTGVPRQNYDDVYIGANGGFDGYVSNLWYFDYALGTTAIDAIVQDGPNLTLKGDDTLNSKPYYLSLRWFFTGTGDDYFPTHMSTSAVNPGIGGANMGLPSGAY
jgi:hypothetical protein